MQINKETDLLLVIDLQNDFCPGGALAVNDGDLIVPGINELASKFDHVVATQDWHPADHSSFASRYEGRSPYETMLCSYGDQVLWPDHCVQGQPGAAFHPDFDTTPCQLILRKGWNRYIDSYSAFFENDRVTPTGLEGYLAARKIQRLFICGLALDYCVSYSAVDARRCGFEVVVLEDLCKAIDLDRSLAVALAEMDEAGVQRCLVKDVSFIAPS